MLPDLAISNASLGVPGVVDDVMILGNEGRGARDQLTPRRGRSPSPTPRRRIVRAPTNLLAQEAMQAAPRAAAVAPLTASVRLVDDGQPLLGRDAETFWASAARPAARDSEPARLALTVARAAVGGTAPWLIDRFFAEQDGGWLR
jgi:hypothetical protein